MILCNVFLILALLILMQSIRDFATAMSMHGIGPEGRFQCREPNHNGATRARRLHESGEGGGGEEGTFSIDALDQDRNENENSDGRMLTATKSKKARKFLLVGGNGAGIGNFLIFFPAAYYFAVLTGREIVVIDGSLIGEMCTVVYCGFPMLSELAEAYPSLISKDIYDNGVINHGNIPGSKVWDWHKHLAHESDLDIHPVLRADGYKFSSGWYFGRNYTEACVAQLTGCDVEDVGCQDRHAMQRLVKGPFKPSEWLRNEETRIIGVPKNLKHAMLHFPHSTAPRIDAAVHMRCQFKHFEYSIGPDDGVHWDHALKEIHDWMNSTDFNKGYQLFKHIEDKIIAEHEAIMKLSQQIKDKRRKMMQLGEILEENELIGVSSSSSSSSTELQASSSNYLSTFQQVLTDFIFYNKGGDRSKTTSLRSTGKKAESSIITISSTSGRSGSSDSISGRFSSPSPPSDVSSDWYVRRNLASNINFYDNITNNTLFETIDHENEDSQYQGDLTKDNKIYVFIASDNDVVKEAFTRYLVANQKKREEANHPLRIAVMRVKNRANIAHAKNLNYLRSAGNVTGVFDLSLDWYFLTLANHIFAWRRDTDILSTFAHSSQRVSGSNELSNPNDIEMSSGIGSLGYQLVFNRQGQPVWRNYS